MSDLVERLLRYRVGGNFGYGYECALTAEAAARITELEQQLAARDGEIADWLMTLSENGAVPFNLEPMSPLGLALDMAASYIASGAYRSNADE